MWRQGRGPNRGLGPGAGSASWAPVGEANGWLRRSAALLDDGSLWLAGVDAITIVDFFHAAVSENPYFGIDWDKLASTPAFSAGEQRA